MEYTPEQIEEMRAMVEAADRAKAEAAEHAIREIQCAPYAVMIQSDAWAEVRDFALAQRAITGNRFAVNIGSLAGIMSNLEAEVRAYLPDEAPEPEA